MSSAQMKQQTFLAKALYDNIAETTDEIPFCRGDILTVLEHDPGGLEGWWLCSMRGKQGIAPANRLKLLTGMRTEHSSPGHGLLLNTTSPGQMSISPSSSFTGSPYQSPRNSLDILLQAKVRPAHTDDGYLYKSTPSQDTDSLDYDVPPTRLVPDSERWRSYDFDSEGNRKSAEWNIYDTPPPAFSPTRSNDNHDQEDGYVEQESTYDTPPSSKNISDNLYDVPPSIQVDNVVVELSDLPSNRSSVLSNMTVSSSTSGTSSTDQSRSVGMSSNPASVCDSARSSLDVSVHDIYDIPPDPRAIKQHSADSGLDFQLYDSPPKARVTDQLPNLTLTASFTLQDYDVPKASPAKIGYSSQTYKSPRSSKEQVLDELYDIPPSATQIKMRTLPRKKRGSRDEVDASRPGGGVYDIPPQVTRDSSDGIDQQRLSTCSNSSSSANSPRNSDLPAAAYGFTELLLDLDSAMDRLIMLQQNVHKSCVKLSSFVTSTWRHKDNLQVNLHDIKQACQGIRDSLEDFMHFAEGTFANSVKIANKKLVKKLYKYLQPVQVDYEQISTCVKNLEDMSWNVSKLTHNSPSRKAKDDDLGKIAMVSKELVSDARKLSSFIQANASVLFKKGHNITSKSPSESKPDVSPKPASATVMQGSLQRRPLPAPPTNDRPLPEPPDKVTSGAHVKQRAANDEDDFDWVEDYDYVQLESREGSAESETQKTSLDTESDTTTYNTSSLDTSDDALPTPVNTTNVFVLPDANHVPSQTKIDNSDKQVLLFYSNQMDFHITALTNAIDTFINSIESNQPPRTFIAHSKFVVLSAHKLVYIGDTLHRNVINTEIRCKVMQCANYLCDCLKLSVVATKTAALQYPAVHAVQNMMDKVVSVSQASRDLRLVITHSACL